MCLAIDREHVFCGVEDHTSSMPDCSSLSIELPTSSSCSHKMWNIVSTNTVSRTNIDGSD